MAVEFSPRQTTKTDNKIVVRFPTQDYQSGFFIADTIGSGGALMDSVFFAGQNINLIVPQFPKTKYISFRLEWFFRIMYINTASGNPWSTNAKLQIWQMVQTRALQLDGIPFDIEVNTQFPDIIFPQNRLKRISIGQISVGYSLDPNNTLTTPVFSVQLAATHQVRALITPIVELYQ
jgi:hypothetical protein